MAISKSLLMKNGVTATYWKIVHISVDVQGLSTSFLIAPFLDQTNADSGSKAVGPGKTYEFDVDSEADIFSGTIDDAYDAILAKAASVVPNIGGGGTHTFDTDLSDGTIV